MRGLNSLACLAVIAASVPAAGRDFRSSDIYPSGSPTVEAMAYMGTLIRDWTGGRHHIESFGQGDRDSEHFTIAQVQTGTLDMARVGLSAFNGTVPETAVLSLPYLFRSEAHLRRVLDGPIGAEILASLKRRDVIGLCFYDLGARSLYSVGKPIRHASDLRGLKIRVQSGDLAATLVRALGATPSPMNYSRIAEALRTGAIDAAESNWSSYVADRHDRFAKFYSLTRHSRPPGVIIFSKRVWRELSDDDRAIIETAARDSVGFLRDRLDVYEGAARRLAESNGTQVIDDVDTKSFADVLLPLYPALLADARQRELLRRIQADDQEASTPRP
jgi:tripartite ATP-independent transporter DctP family solute receptor